MKMFAWIALGIRDDCSSIFLSLLLSFPVLSILNEMHSFN